MSSRKNLPSCSLKNLKEIKHKAWGKWVKKMVTAKYTEPSPIKCYFRKKQFQEQLLESSSKRVKYNSIPIHSWRSFDSEGLQPSAAAHNQFTAGSVRFKTEGEIHLSKKRKYLTIVNELCGRFSGIWAFRSGLDVFGSLTDVIQASISRMTPLWGGGMKTDIKPLK